MTVSSTKADSACLPIKLLRCIHKCSHLIPVSEIKTVGSLESEVTNSMLTLENTRISQQDDPGESEGDPGQGEAAERGWGVEAVIHGAARPHSDSRAC